MTLRELMIEYIMFAFTDEELGERFLVSEEELAGLSNEDLLDIYNHTIFQETN